MRLSKIRKFKHLLESYREQLLYRFPSKKLVVIGVTGTDGKTTTTNLIYHILTSVGIKTAISSTLSSPHMTTYGRGWVHAFLGRSLKNGCTHAVVEVTSLGIDQLRVHGVDFNVGVLTNIADNEHLDYHGTFEQYKKTKIKWLLGCKTVIANADDESISDIKSQIAKSHIKGQRLITYGIKNKADVTPKTLRYTTKLLGEFNTYNILAAVTVCKTLGVDDKAIATGVSSFEPPAGRLEIITRNPFTVIVDFAHTPQAFEQVLPVAKSLKQKATSSLIHVFGATGNRDRGKRPIMAKIAAHFDDYIILTHEDTYTEDPKQIISEIESGLKEFSYTNYLIEYDRREAIRKALALAKRGDVVILTGVGHQKSMNIAGKEVPWSEQKVVREMLKL